jgi:hypothetical protein
VAEREPGDSGAFFAEKVPKRYTFGTEAPCNCLMFRGFRSRQDRTLSAKPLDDIQFQRAALTPWLMILATCSSRHAEPLRVRSARWFRVAAIPLALRCYACGSWRPACVRRWLHVPTGLRPS